MMASHMDPQHRTTLSACRPTAGCACRGTALTAREGGARTSGCRQHSRFDAAETGLIEVPRPKTADRNSPDAPCVIGSSGRGSGFQNLGKQRFPVREAPLDGSGSAGLFLFAEGHSSSRVESGPPHGICLRRRALTPQDSEENFERGLREARQDCRMAADVVCYFGARVA
jgi:hypothetical protein